MPATFGNTSFYETATPAISHTGSLTLGSNSRRKVVVAVLMEQNTVTLTGITFDGTSIIGNARGSNPDVNPNDTLLKLYWYDYDVPSGTGAGSKNVVVTISSSSADVGFHMWEVLDAADGGPESTNVGHAASGANATCSVTATTGAALIAAGLMNTSTTTVTFSGDVTERRENNEPNFTSASADAANVSSGTKSVTWTPSSAARNSVRLASYAEFSGGGGGSSNVPRSMFYHLQGMR